MGGGSTVLFCNILAACDCIQSLALSPDGRTLYSGGADDKGIMCVRLSRYVDSFYPTFRIGESERGTAYR
eukprot:1081546-Pyramimonas_sp.AAC.1